MGLACSPESMTKPPTPTTTANLLKISPVLIAPDWKLAHIGDRRSTTTTTTTTYTLKQVIYVRV